MDRYEIMPSWKLLADVPIGYISSAVGAILYILLNWSYMTAVFTDPGSPLTSSGSSGYSHLPTQEPTARQDVASLTVKSTGDARYCKKCQARKPDRAHHCSTCRRCVLKMDHHCPWLATCVGLRNYKPFLLFLIYTTIFCWLSFAVTATWLWMEVLSDTQYTESLMPINYVLLCTISGIFGLVLTGFTGWHITLAWKGQTTIECLEKTRYLTPLKKSMRRKQFGANRHGGQSYGQQLAEIHANALPGVTRDEEGEGLITPNGDVEEALTAREFLQQNYNDMERSRERERYEDYLDEQDSEKLPNAFDLGWKRNLLNLLGDRAWFLPICNTKGDGWHWEPSRKWIEAREEIRRQREEQWRAREQRASTPGIAIYEEDDSQDPSERHYLTTTNGVAVVPAAGRRSPGKASQVLGRPADGYFDEDFSNERPSSRMSMKTLRRRESFGERTEEDELSSEEERSNQPTEGQHRTEDEWRDWE